MSKEEGHELTDQIATKNANIQEVYETANSRYRNQSNQISRVFLRLFVAISSFFLRHSLFEIHLFVFRRSLSSCQKNKLSRICRTEEVGLAVKRRTKVALSNQSQPFGLAAYDFFFKPRASRRAVATVDNSDAVRPVIMPSCVSPRCGTIFTWRRLRHSLRYHYRQPVSAESHCRAK